MARPVEYNVEKYYPMSLGEAFGQTVLYNISIFSTFKYTKSAHLTYYG